VPDFIARRLCRTFCLVKGVSTVFGSLLKGKSRMRAALLHFFVCVLMAGLVSAVIFKLWYPWPYSELSGGQELFFLLVGVDVTLGPILTLAVFSPAKRRRVLVVDLAVIAALQIGALTYGLHTLFLARPVYLVFEVDRLRVVTAADIDVGMLGSAAPEFRQLPWFGPRLIAARRAASGDELLRSVQLSLKGLDTAMQPDRWISYASAKDALATASKPLDGLLKKYPEVASAVDDVAMRAGVRTEALRFLPLTSRQRSWVALLSSADFVVIGYLPVDGFS
jgi:hypothetical protein